MPELMNDNDPDWGVLDELIGKVRARLQPGGPPVDQEQLFDLIAGDLPDDEARAASERVRTWESWHQEYWKLRAYLAEAEANDELCASLPDSEIPVDGTKSKSPAESENEKSATGEFSTNVRSHPNQPIAHHARRWRVIAMGLVAAMLLLAIAGITFRSRDPLRSLAGVPDHLRGDVETMLASSTIHVPGGITDRFSVMRGSQTTSMYVRPNRTLVREDQPLLQWRSRELSDRYQVFLYPSGEDEPLVSPIITATEWRPTDHLQRGLEYAWEVKTIRGAETLLSDEPRSRFVVLDSESLIRVSQTATDTKEPVLARVAALVQFGLLDEAESLLEESLREHPDSKLARSLRDSLRQQH